MTRKYAEEGHAAARRRRALIPDSAGGIANIAGEEWDA
jgi:hypothetical protein